jgi:hypothetical protein
MDDSFEFDVPDELRPWFEARREKSAMRHYILVGGKIKTTDFLTAARWNNDFNNRIVDRTDISNEPAYPGGDFISTVFLGIDHNFDFFYDEEMQEAHVPILFETMVFGGEHDQRMWRYATYGEAKRGHWQIVDCIRAGLPPQADRGERPFIDYFLEMWDKEKDKKDEDK